MACTPGDHKCIGNDLYECRGFYDPTFPEESVTVWAIIERDSSQCVVEPPEPEPEPTDEELLYANWIRSGGTGSMADWRSLGSPLFYTAEPEYPSTDIRNIAFTVIEVGYPSTDFRNIAFTVIGVEYPSTDIRNINLSLRH